MAYRIKTRGSVQWFTAVTFVMMCILSFVCSQAASADVLAEWTFLDDTSATTQAAGVVAGDVTNGAGFTAQGAGLSGSANNMFVRTNVSYNGTIVTDGDYTDPDNEASVLAVNDYFEFTITPSGADPININTVSFDYFAQDLSTAKGPVSFFKSFMRSSVDSYTATLSSQTFEDVYGTVAADTGETSVVNVVANLDSSYDGLTGTTTFRIYFNDGVNYGDNLLLHRVDNIQIQGTVVPEPATISLLVMGPLMALCRKRKK